MQRFAEIIAAAAERKGGAGALEDVLSKTALRPTGKFAAIGDDGSAVWKEDLAMSLRSR